MSHWEIRHHSKHFQSDVQTAILLKITDMFFFRFQVDLGGEMMLLIEKSQRWTPSYQIISPVKRKGNLSNERRTWFFSFLFCKTLWKFKKLINYCFFQKMIFHFTYLSNSHSLLSSLSSHFPHPTPIHFLERLRHTVVSQQSLRHITLRQDQGPLPYF